MKKIHKRLHMVMELSGEVRNRDFALYLLKKAGTPPDSALSAALLEQKKHAQNELSRLLRRWGKRDFSRKWRSRLRLR